jgi:hypothetical protein
MAIPQKKFEICRSIGELSARSGMPLSNVKVAALFALTREEITRILSLGDLMADVKSILSPVGRGQGDDGEGIQAAAAVRHLGGQ